MEEFNLFNMRETFSQQQIMLCFNGPTSRSLIEEIGNALRHYLEAAQAPPSATMAVFAVYVEMTQNIRHYSLRKNWIDQDAIATVVIARQDDGRYVVSAGNLVEQPDGTVLLRRIEELAALDKAQLKAVYKEQLRKPRPPDALSGAGLGLIDIARTASMPLECSLRELGNGRAYVSLRAVI